MLQQEFSRRLAQYIDVVGRPYFIELGQQLRRSRHIAQTYACQSQLRDCAHHDHIRKFRQARHETGAGKRLISLIDDHDAGVTHLVNNGQHGVEIE